MLQQVQDGYVNAETHNGITTIVFFHPQSNSLPGKILDILAQEISSASHNPACKVIILKSAGEKAFCAGASFDELLQIETETQGAQFFNGFALVINAMRKSPKFIIARIQGKCVGGAVGLASAADYAIAYKDADIKLSELAVGIGPFVVGPAVERKIGLAAFSALAIDASMWRDSEWAKKKGLFAEVHATMEGLDESVQRLSESLSHSNPEAMAALKKTFWHGTEHWDSLLKERAAISGKLLLSDYAQNAITKFKSKSKTAS